MRAPRAPPACSSAGGCALLSPPPSAAATFGRARATATRPSRAEAPAPGRRRWPRRRRRRSRAVEEVEAEPSSDDDVIPAPTPGHARAHRRRRRAQRVHRRSNMPMTVAMEVASSPIAVEGTVVFASTEGSLGLLGNGQWTKQLNQLMTQVRRREEDRFTQAGAVGGQIPLVRAHAGRARRAQRRRELERLRPQLVRSEVPDRR